MFISFTVNVSFEGLLFFGNILVVLLNLGADNLVPMELALKIANKIRANERFSAYVVIPMWPEGVPTSAAVQEILFWQVGLFSQSFLAMQFHKTHHFL